jgi:phosphomannomutase
MTMGAFHAYDIRGVFGKDIDLDLTYNLGRAIALFLTSGEFIIGYDARRHSHDMYRALARGLTAQGRNVTGIGLCSTPQLHFMQVKRGYACGIMVTASHNPPEYHGVKLFGSDGGSISYAKGLNKVEDLLGRLPARVASTKGRFSEIRAEDEYIGFLAGSAHGRRYSLKAVVDAANGSAGHIFKRLARELGLDCRVINGEPDGSFPNHQPNPLLPQSREQAAQAVLHDNADVGIVLDGDGDRIIAVDESGSVVENYFLSGLIAEKLLQDHPGAAVVYDLISSRVLPEYITRYGGRPIVSRVGYTFIYDAMTANRAVFGCETSGHVYFKVDEAYYTESAAYAFILLLDLLEEKKTPLSRLVAPLKNRFFQAPELNLEVQNKEAALAAIDRAYADAQKDRLDGISVNYPDFWFNVRPSNTEPLLRVRLEATSRELAMEKYGELKDLILHSD